MSLNVTHKNVQRRIFYIQRLLIGGGILLVIYTLYDWLILERSLYTGYSVRHFNDYVAFIGWLFLSISFYLLKRWVIKKGILLRMGFTALSVGLIFISFAYFFNGWIDGISFPGFVITYYPGILIASLGLSGCIFSPVKIDQYGIYLHKALFTIILLLLLISCFLPFYYFTTYNDKATATIIRNISHVLIGVAFVIVGFLLKRAIW